MGSIMFRCPMRNIHTHAWIADDVQAKAGEHEYVSVDCLACRRSHLVNPRTGAVMGSDKDSESDR